MRESPLRHAIQWFAAATQFPPFVWFYHLLYAAAVRVAAARLRRIPGVRAIYLGRGLASGASVYGLADIDLTLIVEGG